MPITVSSKGNYDRTIKSIEAGADIARQLDLDKYGREGVELLKVKTPSHSGRTAQSWYYDITKERNTVSINFKNSYIENGMNVAIIIDKGHATKKGNWVAGKHYIDDAIDVVYKEILEAIKRGGS